MTETVRRLLAGIWLAIALGALIGLVAHVSGVDLGEGARPMLFARALVLSVGLLIVTLKWRTKPHRRGGGGRKSK